jgi:RHS repeat-associated protein
VGLRQRGTQGTFDDWGKLVAESGSTTCRLRLPGQIADDETGFHYNRFRYYSPEAGQFVSADPIGFGGGMNQYRVAPNAIGWVDPLGLKCGSCAEGEAARVDELAGRGWNFNPSRDVDMRGGPGHRAALDEAFRRTGVPREQFTVSKWGRDANGKTMPVEYTGPNGAQVNMDIPAWNNVRTDGSLGYGPHQPHIGYQTPGRGEARTRGHIFVDYVPATR